jgi:FkbM family methyltransferase
VRLAPGGKHIAYEAVPHKAEWLRKKFPEVSVEALAISDAPGTARFFHVIGASALSGLNADRSGGSEIEVRCARLDDLLAADYEPGLLKIEVIGAELRVLIGAERTLARARPAILLASGREKLASSGVTPENVFDWLSERGYALFFFRDYLEGGDALARDAFVNAHNYPYEVFNYVAIHRA